MKRLFALCGFVYLFVQIALFYVCKELAYVFTVIAVVAGVVTLIFSKDKYFKNTICVACVVSILSSVIFCSYSSWYFNDVLSKHNNQEAEVFAQLIEEPHRSYGMYYYQLKTETINGKNESYKILLSTAYEIDIEVFDYFTFTNVLNECKNKGYLSKGFIYSVNAGFDFDYQITKSTNKPWYFYIIELRKTMKQAINTLMPAEIAELSTAIAIGDRFSINENLKDDFRKTGVSHFIVVSGLHLVIVSEFVRRFISLITRQNRYAECFGTTAVIFAFVALTGFGSSAIRAGIMMIIFMFGRLVFRNADSLNSLGIAVLLLCVPNPFAVGDIGLLLSVFATLGIILFAKKAEDYLCPKINLKFNRLNRIAIYVVKTLIVTASAFIFILPVTLLAFNSFSPMVYIATIFISPVVSVFIISVLLSAILYSIGFLSVFAYPFAFVACVIGRFVIFVVNVLSQFKYAVVYVESVYIVFFLFVSGILIAVALLFENYKRYLKYSALITALLIPFIFIISIFPKADTLHITYSGKGSTVFIKSSEGTAVLSCGGSASKSFEVIESLAVKGKDIDYLTIADNNKTSSRFAGVILEEFDCFNVLLYDNDKTNEEAYRNSKNADTVITFSENQTVHFKLWNNGTVDIINIDGNSWQFVNYKGNKILIIPQKADSEDIPKEFRTADYIISSNCPENYNLLKCHTFVYTGLKEDMEKYISNFDLISEEIATTIDQSVVYTLE